MSGSKKTYNIVVLPGDGIGEQRVEERSQASRVPRSQRSCSHTTPISPPPPPSAFLPSSTRTTGPEVVEQAVRVLELISSKSTTFELKLTEVSTLFSIALSWP